jgi:hypothetical protein
MNAARNRMAMHKHAGINIYSTLIFFLFVRANVLAGLCLIYDKQQAAL